MNLNIIVNKQNKVFKGKFYKLLNHPSVIITNVYYYNLLCEYLKRCNIKVIVIDNKPGPLYESTNNIVFTNNIYKALSYSSVQEYYILGNKGLYNKTMVYFSTIRILQIDTDNVNNVSIDLDKNNQYELVEVVRENRKTYKTYLFH